MNSTRSSCSGMYVNVDGMQKVKLTEGWLEQKSTDNIWKRYWCVLRNDTIFFFNNQKATDNYCLGRIALSPESRLMYIDGDGSSGYLFSLRTNKNTNIFKAAKYDERETWRAFINGVIFGVVSIEDVDLLPGKIEEIWCTLETFLLNRQLSIPSRPTEPASNNLTAGFDPPDSGYIIPVERRLSLPQACQTFKFHSDPSRSDIPSWFFPSCSRETAMQILTLGSKYGNTLMRESTSHKNTLAISKRTEAASNRPEFTHYAITMSPQGYKIDVENQHKPMQSLSEVMDFFVSTSGQSTTRPMTCNDLGVLGIENYGDYTRKIVTMQTDADSGEETTQLSRTEGKEEDQDIYYDPGPPNIIAPPLPVLKKESKPLNTTGSHERWHSRSISVPNINQQDLKTAIKQSSSGSKGPIKSHIIKTQVKQINKTETLHENGTTVAVVPKIPPPPDEVPPPLPKNHPPPLNKAHSQSAFKLTPDIPLANVKKTGSKHTQSFNSADIQVRTTSPRDRFSPAKKENELEQVLARFNKKTEVAEEAQKPIDSVIPVDEIKSSAVPEGFKKKLEGLIAGANTAGLSQRNQNLNPSNVNDNTSHYQNADVILNSRKN